MSKRTLLPLLLLVILTQSGCFSYIEELFLQKDGSGKIELSYDLSSMFQNEFYKTMMLSALGNTDEGETREQMEMDTTAYLSDPSFPLKENFADRPDLMEGSRIKIKVSEKEEIAKMTFVLDFKDISDLEAFRKIMIKDKEDPEVKKMGNFLGIFISEVKDIYCIKGNKFQRKAIPPTEEVETTEEENPFADLLETGTYQSIVHLPGKVKKATNPNSKIAEDGKTVITKIPYQDYLDGKGNLANTIKFK